MKLIYLLLLFIVTGCHNNEAGNYTDAKNNPVAISNTNGETLFKANCASCHKPNVRYIGPALQGVTKRWESKELLYDFVRNSQEVIGRNAYAKKLFKEYNQSPMLPYPQLTDEDIQGILDYCDNYK